MNIGRIAAGIVLASIAAHAQAVDGAKPADAASAPTEKLGNAISQKTSAFFDQWGVGLAMVRAQVPSISDASIVGGVVRVNGKVTNEATWLIARHFYPWNPGKECLNHERRKETDPPDPEAHIPLCVGAMVGIGLGTSGGSGSGGQLINFGGIGLTLGGSFSGLPSTKWNLGFGIGRKFNVKTLGDGFKENEAPPTGETQVRYKYIDTRANFAYFAVHW